MSDSHRYTLRAVLCLIACNAFSLFVATGISKAAVFRVDLDSVVNDAYPDDNFLRGEYDLGTRFTSIESVTIEFLMPMGMSAGYCSGGGCASSSLFVELHSTDHIVERPEMTTALIVPEGTELTLLSPLTLPSNSEQLTRSISYVLPNRLTSIQFLAEWPTFLLSGKGAITFQRNTIFSRSSLNFPDAPTTFSYGKPSGISLATIVIDATPVPEPTGLTIVVILAAFPLLWQRRRMRLPT